VNFNVNFNVLLNKYIVYPLVKIKDFDNIKMHDTTMKLKADNFVKLDEPEFGAGYPLFR
jgi:hypothetical protein